MSDISAAVPATDPAAPRWTSSSSAGAGHVGLPLSLAFADAGLRVGIYDINGATLERIGRGEMPFMESGADQLLVEVLATGRLELSADAEIIGRADAVLLVIGTPVDEFLGPSMRVFERAVDQISPNLRDGSLVVLRSTVYPGTTEYVAAALADRGKQVDVAFCPERIAEGHALEELAHAAPDHRRGHARRPPIAPRRCSGGWRPRRCGPRARRPSSPSCSRTRGGT